MIGKSPGVGRNGGSYTKGYLQTAAMTHVSEHNRDKTLPDVRCNQCGSKLFEVESSGKSVIQIKCRRCGTFLRITV